MTAAIVSLISMFSLFTAIAQLRPHLPWVPFARYDPWGLLPGYLFFAPLPRTIDLRLVFRTSVEGQARDWQELPVYQEKPWYRFLFNPSKYRYKGLSDNCQYLVITEPKLEGADKKALQVSMHYINLLKLIHEFRDTPPLQGETVEFAVVSSRENAAARQTELAYRSHQHPLSPNSHE